MVFFCVLFLEQTLESSRFQSLPNLRAHLYSSTDSTTQFFLFNGKEKLASREVNKTARNKAKT